MNLADAIFEELKRQGKIGIVDGGLLDAFMKHAEQIVNDSNIPFSTSADRPTGFTPPPPYVDDGTQFKYQFRYGNFRYVDYQAVAKSATETQQFNKDIERETLLSVLSYLGRIEKQNPGFLKWILNQKEKIALSMRLWSRK